MRYAIRCWHPTLEGYYAGTYTVKGKKYLITKDNILDKKVVTFKTWKGVENHLNNLVIALSHTELNMNRYLEIERI